MDRRFWRGLHLDPFAFTWIHLDSLGPIGLPWTHLGSLGLAWIHLDSLGLTWTHLDSLGLTWTHLDSLALTSTHQNSLELTSSHQDSLDPQKTRTKYPPEPKGKRERGGSSIFSNSDLTTRPRVRTHERNETISRLGSLSPTSDTNTTYISEFHPHISQP